MKWSEFRVGDVALGRNPGEAYLVVSIGERGSSGIFTIRVINLETGARMMSAGSEEDDMPHFTIIREGKELC